MNAHRIGQAVLYSAGLTPVSAASLGLLVAGRPATADRLATGWQSRLGPPPELRGRFLPVAANAVMGLLLGLLTLIPLAVEVIVVARGLFYGWVDPGPYDTSWGGPSRGGAWLVHFLISIPIAAAGIAALIGIAALHRRWTARLAGEPGGAWVLPVAILCVAAEVAFFIAWLHQI
ncbi:hypothetical protein GCM10010168_00010 [Actinoplanes ianthinogenes]|uniref:Uncharacterized protein n=1 Tax=Actinoplanes ianthinogenes TaxID=122358 RepID=A0ABN6CG04_9ACTN|nr:hypothetical protein [Actinoplanes ianthinogenes]BCJ43257.1 hypothetical protein Aiant_39140 [Actinoplanes ianthinogenes]GGQ89234.1 hypothetical protein GCM10010168_00010 [Actinoplanes ianthinogenes]